MVAVLPISPRLASAMVNILGLYVSLMYQPFLRVLNSNQELIFIIMQKMKKGK